MKQISNTTNIALDRLETWFAGCPSAAVAMSGGVDSSLVAYVARHCLGRSAAVAYLADSASLKRSDLDLARGFCADYDIELVVLETQELQDPDYAANPSNRCYFCKTTLYSAMWRQLPDDGSVWLLNGTNNDDLGDYRPGLQAGEELKVRSPLVECGLDKATVRGLAQELELDCWDKPASPCLSSRIPYGQSVTVEKLAQIEAGEALLERLGFPVSRLRHYGDLALVEVEQEQLGQLEQHADHLETGLRELGFSRVETDREGFVSGKLNRSVGK